MRPQEGATTALRTRRRGQRDSRRNRRAFRWRSILMLSRPRRAWFQPLSWRDTTFRASTLAWSLRLRRRHSGLRGPRCGVEAAGRRLRRLFLCAGGPSEMMKIL